MRKRATQCVKPKDPLDGYVSGVDANRRANFSRLLSLCLLLRLLNRARSFMCRADARRETRTILRERSIKVFSFSILSFSPSLRCSYPLLITRRFCVQLTATRFPFSLVSPTNCRNKRMRIDP